MNEGYKKPQLAAQGKQLVSGEVVQILVLAA